MAAMGPCLCLLPLLLAVVVLAAGVSHAWYCPPPAPGHGHGRPPWYPPPPRASPPYHGKPPSRHHHHGPPVKCPSCHPPAPPYVPPTPFIPPSPPYVPPTPFPPYIPPSPPYVPPTPFPPYVPPPSPPPYVPPPSPPPYVPPTPSPPPYVPPAPGKTCPIDALKLKACVDVLGGLVHLVIGREARGKCCPLVHGVADLDAAVCLCTTIRARLLNINIYLPVALQLLITCGKHPPQGFTCPPLGA